MSDTFDATVLADPMIQRREALANGAVTRFWELRNKYGTPRAFVFKRHAVVVSKHPEGYLLTLHDRLGYFITQTVVARRSGRRAGAAASASP